MINRCDMKTHIVADKLVCLKVCQKLVVELLLCQLPVQVFWVVLRGNICSSYVTNVSCFPALALVEFRVLLHCWKIFAALFTTAPVLQYILQSQCKRSYLK